jgi:hypothetical protein
MDRRRTAEEYNRTAAQNGWVPGAHEEEDGRQQTKNEPGERYKKNQQEALDQCQSPSVIGGLLVTIMCFGPGILRYSPTKNLSMMDGAISYTTP